MGRGADGSDADMIEVMLVILFVLNAIFILSTVATRARIGKVCQALGQFKLVLSEMQKSMWCCRDLDPIDRHVERELLARRVERARKLLILGCIGIEFFLGTIVYNVLGQRQRHMSLAQDILVAISCVGVGALRVLPRLINAKTLDIWYSSLMVVLVVGTSPIYETPSALQSWGVFYLMAGIIGACFNLHVKLVAFWTIVLSCMRCYSVIVSPASSAYGFSKSFIIISIISESGMFLGLTWFLAANMARVLRKGIESRIAQNQLSAVHIILSSVCDLVVEIDSDFQLVEDVPQLGGLLLLEPARSLKGASLENFIVDHDDVEFFSGEMRRLSNCSGGLASVFHTKMRDLTGGLIDMEMFAASLKVYGERDHYLIGMREFTDVEPIVSQSVSEKKRKNSTRSMRSIQAMEALVLPERSLSGESRKSHSTKATRDGGCVEQISVSFKTSDFIIVHASPSFELLFNEPVGASVGADIRDWLVRGGHFVDFANGVANAFLDGDFQAYTSIGYGNLKLKSPSAASPAPIFKAKCSVSLLTFADVDAIKPQLVEDLEQPTASFTLASSSASGKSSRYGILDTASAKTDSAANVRKKSLSNSASCESSEERRRGKSVALQVVLTDITEIRNTRLEREPKCFESL